MRVLHLPSNLASQISNMVRAQRAIGIDARGLVFDAYITQTTHGVRAFSRVQPGGWALRAQLAKPSRWYEIASSIAWADVIHWHSKEWTLPLQMDLKLSAWLDKARLVEFWGSEIRIGDVAAVDNPFLARLLARPGNNYDLGYAHSRRTQERFAHYGFACLVPGPELGAYVQADLFPRPYQAETVVNVGDFVPHYPDPGRRKPVVVHAPSNLAIKGTEAVLRAVEQLRAQYDFEFRLIHNLPRAQALAMVAECDIMLDQFVIGAYGAAALEAMALGKPTVCYLKPAVAGRLPAGAPFVNANQDDLPEVLASLLADGLQRRDIGCRSRAYVETYHDGRVVARQLEGVYRELLAQRRQR